MNIEDVDRHCDRYEKRLKQGERLRVAAFLESENLGDDPALVSELKKVERDYQPAASSEETTPERSAISLPPRYQPLGEIARGGMGAVWRVVDRHFDRTLAMKVTLKKYLRDAQVTARFEREAQLTGTLQHPAIPPVVDRGVLDDGTPFFSMKLVEGQTLAELLAARSTPTSELTRFLSIFEQLCQGVGYAHSRGIIHRDLKPANVMVGAFGEVQVMDWGMAKETTGTQSTPTVSTVANSEGSSQRPPAVIDAAMESTVNFIPPAESTDAMEGTVSDNSLIRGEGPDSVGNSELTRDGQVMGTLAYMPPEQAHGDIDQMNSRSDVFGLGAILCEILTGDRPFTGDNIWNQVFDANLQPAYVRINRTECDEDLKHLCRSCLAVAPDERPNDGATVAKAISDYQQSVQRRLEEERTVRVAAEIKAVEERKRRRVLLALAVSVVLLVIGGGSVAMWFQKLRADERTRGQLLNQKVSTALDDAERQQRELRQRLADTQTASILLSQIDDWERLVAGAQSSLNQAKNLANADERLLSLDLRERLQLLEKQLLTNSEHWHLAKQLDVIRHTHSIPMISVIVEATSHLRVPSIQGQARRGRFAPELAGPKYAEVFRKAGFDFDRDDLATINDRIANSPIRLALVVAVVHWLEITADKDRRQRLADLTQEAGHGADELLDVNTFQKASPSERRDIAVALSRKIPPQIVSSLTRTPRLSHKDRMLILQSALTHYPGDFELLMESGLVTKKSSEKAAYFRAALAVRPSDSGAWNNLGVALMAQQSGAAIEAFREATSLDPTYADAWANLGIALCNAGHLDGAANACNQALAQDPNNPSALTNLALTMVITKRFADAEKLCRRVVRLEPHLLSARCNLGSVLAMQKKLGEAQEIFRAIIADDPRYARAHYELGVSLTDQNKIKSAKEAFRKAVTHKPDLGNAHYNLGLLLAKEGKIADAEMCFRHATESNPTDHAGWSNLGTALAYQGKFSEAELAYKQCTVLKADEPHHWENLGTAQLKQKKFGVAESAFRHTIHLDGKKKGPRGKLGAALLGQGKFSEALNATQEELKSLPIVHPLRSVVRQQLRQCQTLLKMEDRLPAIREGVERPSATELIALAELHTYKQRYLAAARYYQQAFVANPSLAKSTVRFLRTDAACAAIMTAAGNDVDAADVKAEERVRWREQAIEWLSADIAALKRIQESALSGLLGLRKQLRSDLLRLWTEPYLASVRHTEQIDKLPKAEQARWRSLWCEVRTLRNTISQ